VTLGVVDHGILRWRYFRGGGKYTGTVVYMRLRLEERGDDQEDLWLLYHSDAATAVRH
jgi:hypothetical protein